MQDGKHVILVIDDDPDVLDIMRLVLQKHEYIMVSAQTAEEGLRLYKESQPDLVIVDLMMEEVDSGTSLVKELKVLRNTAPVFLLSSVGDNLHVSTDYAELGLAGIFQKPVKPEFLLETLELTLKS